MAQTPRRWWSQFPEPYVLVPLFALFLIAGTWATLWNLASIERATARRAAAQSSRELVDTYEAQVVRAMREIDLTLKTVKLAYERRNGGDVLPDLSRRELLLPDVLFVVSLTDSVGRVRETSQPRPDVSGSAWFAALRDGERGLTIGDVPGDGATPERRMEFGRRIDAPDGTFAGAAVVSVDAAYFVSGYESTRLGNEGVVALVAIDGAVHVRRSGDVAMTDGAVPDVATLVAAQDASDAPTDATLLVTPWDGVRRYTSVRQLYEHPLVALVGLSENEQLLPADASGRVYRRWGIGISVALLALGLAFGRISWQLAQSRRRIRAAQIAHAQRVEYLAYHDGLTGLPNRSMFSKLLAQGIAHARQFSHPLAVLFLDLDRFKHINDTLGHDAGDQLLQSVARRLQQSIRGTDIVARLGGDEFVLLLGDFTSRSDVVAVAEKIVAAIAQPFVLIGQEFRVTASLGISTFPDDGLDEQTLTKNADIAMYQAKAEGKNTFQFYSQQLNVESLERLTLESRLRHALERNEFALLYQAKRDLRSGKICGMEALLRWHHPDLGVVAPMQFIPIADETGLIVPIGRWVLREACRQNVAWLAQGLPRLIMAVNLTARQFVDENLLQDLATALRETGMEPSLLELEITEGMLLQNVDRTLRTLVAVRQLGVRIAIDDFGVGYSSLSALQQFPLDTIKIDRSLIRDVASVAEDRALAGAIIAMGRSLSLTVVAQGVETKEQADFLQQNACDELQGFYFNRPVSAAEFSELVTQHVASARPV